MKSLEFYKNRTNDALEDALISGESTPEGEVFESNLKNIFSKKSSKFERLRAFLSIAKKIIPEILLEKYKNSFYDLSEFPFDLENFSFEGKIGGGGESSVYLLQAKEKNATSYVFKILHPKFYSGKNIDTMLEFAEKRKQEHKNAQQDFIEMPNLIPEEIFLIIKNPKNIKDGAVASIQEFVGHDMRDLFDIPTEEIKKMCAEDINLKNEIKKFAEINMRLYKEENKIIDFLGPKNVSIIQTQKGEFHLVFIDPNLFFSGNSKDLEEEDHFERNKKRLFELETLAQSI